MPSEPLKPCVNCGCDEVESWEDVPRKKWWIECGNDGCGYRTDEFGSVEEAIAAWDTRREESDRAE